MSRTDNDQSVREQSVYVQATMDGTLEKKSQGVLRTKTKLRCWLQGSTLYEQKDQDVKFHDLRQAQTARKVTNDPTGTQFEIVIKRKTHTYICPSSRECTKWVSALQRCMMLRDSSDTDSHSKFYMDEDVSLYATIDDTSTSASPPSMTYPSSETVNDLASTDYYTPHDAVEGEVTNHSEYEAVVLRKSSYEFGSLNTQTDNSKGEAAYNEYTDGISAVGEPVNNDYSDGISTVEESGNNEYSEGVSDPATAQSYPYATVSKTKLDPENALAILETALADCDLPDDDLPYSLVSEDLSCIRTLKTFLHSNKMYYRSSLNNSSNEDCLSALKASLSTLSVE